MTFFFFLVWLVSNGSFHWTRWMVDTCPLLNTCLNPDMSNENFHQTQTVSYFFLLSKLMKRGAMDANIWFTFVGRDGMNKLNSKGGSTV